MAKEKDIKEELLKQMGGDSAEATEVSETSPRKIIEKHKIHLRWLKWIAAASWLIAVLYALGMHVLKDFVLKNDVEGVLTRNEFMLIRYSDAGLLVLTVISVLVTYLCYCKSKALTMIQICARLASIEEHLKRISLDK